MPRGRPRAEATRRSRPTRRPERAHKVRGMGNPPRPRTSRLGNRPSHLKIIPQYRMGGEPHRPVLISATTEPPRVGDRMAANKNPPPNSPARKIRRQRPGTYVSQVARSSRTDPDHLENPPSTGDVSLRETDEHCRRLRLTKGGRKGRRPRCSSARDFQEPHRPASKHPGGGNPKSPLKTKKNKKQQNTKKKKTPSLQARTSV